MGQTMKRKTVLRFLACALACVMLFETPLQAAELTGNTGSTGTYTSTEGEEEKTQDPNENQDKEKTSDDETSPGESQTPAGTDGTSQTPSVGTDGPTSGAGGSTAAGDQEGSDGSGSNGPSMDNPSSPGNEPAGTPPTNGGLNVLQEGGDSSLDSTGNEDPTAGQTSTEETPTEQKGTFTLTFETEMSEASEEAFDPDTYEEELEVLEGTLGERAEHVDLADKQLTLETVQELLAYIIQQGETDTSCLRSEVSYTYILMSEEDPELQMVQSLDFSYLILEAPEVTAEAHDFTGVQLEWNSVEGASAYEVYRIEVQGEETAEAELLYTTEENSGETSYKDENIFYGETYIYQVKALCTEEGRAYRSDLSNEARILAEADAPEGLSASAGGNMVELSWEAVEGATGYEIEAMDASGAYVSLGSVAGETSYTHEGLEYDAVYTYRVRAVRQNRKQRAAAVYSDYSGAVEVKTETPVLEAVSLAASAGAWNQVQLTWQGADASAGYELERKADGGAYARIADIQAGSAAYTDTSVEPGIQYTYRIRPVKQLGSQTFYGEYSGEQQVQTVLGTPASGSVNTSDAQSLTVSWGAVDGADGYELYRSASSGSGYSLAATVASGKTEYRDTGLAIGSTYFYQVRAYHTVNGKNVYSDYSPEMSGMVKLSTVAGLRVQMTKYNTLQLNWNAVGDARTYEVYYSTSPNSGYKRATSTKKTTYKFSKAKCGQTYYFKIRTYEKIGKVKYYSDYCAEVSGMTVLTGTPTVYVSKTKYNSVTIKWSKVPSTKKYEIYYSTSPDGPYTLLKSQGGTSYTHKKLTTGATYYYKVRPMRDYFYGEFSNVTSARPVLGELKNLKVKTGTNQLKISWKSVSGASAYVLMRSDSQNGDYVEISRAKKTSYTDKGLPAGTTYYYKVYAVAGVYQTNTLGPVGEATKPPKQTVTTPSKPSVEKHMYYGVDVSSYQGKIDWEDVADDGIDFAMIRILTGKRTSNLTKDTYFEYNYQHAREEGIKVGVYRYTYATTKSGARQEATEIVDALNGRYLEYPVVLDLEDSMILNQTTREKRTEIIQEYKKIVERAGYKFALYANKNWLDNYIEPEALEGVDIWLARWRSLDQGPGYSGPGNLTMWQYTSTGRVNGISGNVDRNVSYKNYK